MTSPSINQNFLYINESDLKQLLECLLNLHRKDIELNFNCHHLGTIQSFNPENQTVTVSINYKQTRSVFIENTQKYEYKLEDYPVIQDCPLIVLGGGKARITFPVQEGDQCILLFNDRDVENWFMGSTTSPNATPILHGFSDCVALIGPNNLNTIIQDYDAVRALITNGNVKLGIHPENNKITIQNESVGSLNSLLQSLCTQLQNLTEQLSILTVTGVTPGSPTDLSGIPSNAAAITGIGTNISEIATQISTLLE